MSAVFMGSFPVFLEPVSRDLGWGRATFPQFLTIASVSAALLMPIGGRLVDRVGIRWPVTGGLLLVSAGMLLLAVLQKPDVVFWLAALFVGAGSAFAGPPAFIGLISSWYDRNRALALGCVISVAPALGQAIISPVAQNLVSEWGWRGAYQTLALVTLAAALVAAAGFLRVRPLTSSTGTSGQTMASAGQALRTPTFWLLMIGSSLSSATIIGTTVHIVAWQTGRGVPADTAALVLSALSIAGMAGAFLAGYAADRARSIHLLQVFYALPILGLAAMAASVAVPALLLGAICIGVAMGATAGLAPFLATRYFGLKASAEIFGIILAVTMVALGIVPMLIGIGYDLTGNYDTPLLVAAAVIAIAAICIGLLDRADRYRPLSMDAQTPIMVEE
ncbi:MFS transporter [Novosphingobium resinovorum]|uniref:MFS transporter n=1 Tax=Novosphingobium resinovorum TaxID=158500 RepID=UPI002ED14D18|nr:MFS transporter [Novosphingobium resinovorum]